jgi:hypothetical protein
LTSKASAIAPAAAAPISLEPIDYDYNHHEQNKGYEDLTNIQLSQRMIDGQGISQSTGTRRTNFIAT